MKAKDLSAKINWGGVLVWLLATSLPVQAQNTTTDVNTDAPRTIIDSTDSTTTQAGGGLSDEALNAIIGGVVGGVLLILLLLFLCVCVCCCCYRKRRRQKAVVLDHRQGAQVSTTFNRQDPNGYHPVNEDAMFEMQMNIADSMVSREVNETNMPVDMDLSVRNPHPVLVPQDSYVEMGSYLRGSKSADNIIDLRDDPAANEAYCNTDTIVVSAGIASIATGKHLKPLPAPKPAHLQPDATPVSQEEPERSQEGEEQGEDVYVEADVFIQDRQQQDEDDSYYNADTIQTIREGRPLIEVVDPVQTHTVYGNIDPPPAPEHRGKQDKPPEQEENYETVEDFLGSGTSYKSKNTPDYYNYNPLDPPVRPEPAAPEEDYNYVEVIKPDVEDPYTLEDNQYIFMQSRLEPPPIGSSRPVDQFLEARSHTETTPTEDTDSDVKKYQNFDPVQDKRRYVNIGDMPTGARPLKEEILAELHFPVRGRENQDGPSPGSGLEDQQEEMYEELT